MKTATIRDLRNDFARLSKWLDKGETIEIIKRGKHVADLVPSPAASAQLCWAARPAPIPSRRTLTTRWMSNGR